MHAAVPELLTLQTWSPGHAFPGRVARNVAHTSAGGGRARQEVKNRDKHWRTVPWPCSSGPQLLSTNTREGVLDLMWQKHARTQDAGWQRDPFSSPCLHPKGQLGRALGMLCEPSESFPGCQWSTEVRASHQDGGDKEGCTHQ